MFNKRIFGVDLAVADESTAVKRKRGKYPLQNLTSIFLFPKEKEYWYKFKRVGGEEYYIIPDDSKEKGQLFAPLKFGKRETENIQKLGFYNGFKRNSFPMTAAQKKGTEPVSANYFLTQSILVNNESIGCGHGGCPTDETFIENTIASYKKDILKQLAREFRNFNPEFDLIDIRIIPKGRNLFQLLVSTDNKKYVEPEDHEELRLFFRK
jgi:hypothetical protein